MVMFWLPYCRKCKAMHPRFKMVAKQFEGRGIKFGEVNIKTWPKLSKSLDIKVAPLVKLWGTPAEISEAEMKMMRNSAKALTKMAEKCLTERYGDEA